MLLAEHFLSKFNLKYGKDIKRLSTPAINMLMAYHWPGNVRELENCMERAVITAQDDCIYGYNLPASLQMPRDVRTVLKIKPTMLPTYRVGVMAPPTVPQPNTTATADTFTRSRTSASRVP